MALHPALIKYKTGEISIGRTAEELGISISELMDLLVKLRIPSPVTFEDYLEGQKNAEKYFK